MSQEVFMSHDDITDSVEFIETVSRNILKKKSPKLMLKLLIEYLRYDPRFAGKLDELERGEIINNMAVMKINRKPSPDGFSRVVRVIDACMCHKLENDDGLHGEWSNGLGVTVRVIQRTERYISLSLSLTGN